MTPSQQTQPGNICADEDFCKGCDNFDAFGNSCKKTSYKTSIGGKKETIHPRTNESRWLLAIVGCESDTRPHTPIRNDSDFQNERNKVLDELEKIPTYSSDLGDMILLSEVEVLLCIKRAGEQGRTSISLPRNNYKR